MLCRVAEDALEGEPVNVAVAGEERSESFLEEAPTELRDDFELLDSGGAVNAVGDAAAFLFMEKAEGGLKGLYAEIQIAGVESHSSLSQVAWGDYTPGVDCEAQQCR